MIKPQQVVSYLITSIVVILASFSALAMTAEAKSAGSAVRVSPVRTDIEVEAGSSKVVKITITNSSEKRITLQAIANDFVASDEDGTPALILDPSSSAPTHSLKQFMSAIPDTAIEPGQSQVVSVTISVPASAQAGGYFGAVRFIPAGRDDGGHVNLRANLASLILLKVPGDVVEKLQLTASTIHKKDESFDTQFFLDPKDLQLTVRFENKGNVQVSPFGKLTVKKGNTVFNEADFNVQNPHDMVLPDSARRWTVPLSYIDGFGKYTVMATLTYGEDNKTVTFEKSFWVVPVKILILVGIGLVGLIVLLIGSVSVFRFRHRRRKPQLGTGRGRRRR